MASLRRCLCFRTRRRRWWLGAIATALVVSLAALLLDPRSSGGVRAQIGNSAAVRHGAVARIGVVHVGVWPFLRLEGFDLDRRYGVRLHADMIEATWPGRLRLAVRAATLTGPAGIRVSSPVTAWDVAGIFGEDLRLTLVEPQAGLSIRKVAYPVGGAWNIEARGLDVGRQCSTCGETTTRCSMVVSRTAGWTFRPAPMRSVSTRGHGRTRARPAGAWRIAAPTTRRSSAIRRT